MKKTLLMLVLVFLSVKGFGQTKGKIEVTTERKYSINGKSITENDTIKISKKKLLNSKKDSVNNGIRTFVIEYDFQTGKFPNGKKIKPEVDEPVVFKIKNINRLAYSVNIRSKDSVIGFSDLELLLKKNEVEEIMKNVKKAEASPPLLNNNLSVKDSDFLKSENDKTKRGIAKMVNDINETNVKLLEQLNSKINELSTGDNKIVTKIDESSTDDNENVIKINIDSVKIPASLEEKFPYHFKTQTDLTNLYLSILGKHQKLISLWNYYLQVNTIINNPLLNKENLNKSTNTITTIYNKFNDNRNILDDFNLLVNRFENQYNALKSNPEITNQTNYGGSLKLFSIVDNLNHEIQSIKRQAETIKFETLRKNVDQIYILLIENDNTATLFEYVSDPIQPCQDVAIFKVKVDKNDKNTSLFYNERDFTYKTFTRHGIRFDLNIGVAGSFYNTDFYEIKADSNDVSRITKTDKSGFSPSFVGFFTTSYRSATHWTYGLSAGVGISADDGTITLDNFFIGPSLIVGRYERINLTAGISLKNLRKLNGGFTEGQQVANVTTIEAVTTKSYEPGFFIALTYNLTKAVKNNVKQIKNLL